MSVRLTDGTTDNNVDTTSKGIVVQNPKVAVQAGFVGAAAIRDAGTVTGAATVTPIDASVQGRIRAGLDTVILNDQFNYTAQNTGEWSNNLTTMTMSYASGVVTLNNGASVASGAFAVHKSYAVLPLFGAGGVHVEFRGYLTQVPQANNTVYLGIGIPGTTAGPTDGAYFQYDAAGTFKAVVNWNGTTSTSAALTAPSANVVHKFAINQSADNCEFWIDGVLQAIVALPAAAGTTSLNGAAPVFVQNTNTGAVATAQQVKIFTIIAWLSDTAQGRPWSDTMCADGQMAYQGQNGGTMGSTAANMGNSAALPTTAAGSNTAANATGLGGLFAITAAAGAATDFIATSFQNPAGSVTQTPRKLVIRGVYVSAFNNGAAVATTPTTVLMGLAFGHTAVSLATTETATTKAPRRLPLGFMTWPVAAAIGAMPTNGPIYVPFTSPIVVNPGEFIASVLKFVTGTATGSQSIVGSVVFDAYFE